jgi:hypothetical protein
MRAISALFWLSFLAASAQAQLFTDNFTRGSDPGPLNPWVIGPGSEAGNWVVTGGALVGGPNTSDSFGFAYVTNSWTDYSVQARVRFSSVNADAGGILIRAAITQPGFRLMVPAHRTVWNWSNFNTGELMNTPTRPGSRCKE